MLSSDPNPFRGENRPMNIPMERVENRILTIRGHRGMVDAIRALMKPPKIPRRRIGN